MDQHDGTMHICRECYEPVAVTASKCPSCGSDMRSRRSSGQAAGSASGLVERLLPSSHLQRLVASGASLAPERRTVTMLFADVANSTALTEQLDAETVTNVMNRAFEVMVAPVLRYEGMVSRLMGDGLMCLFGAPLSHEDDPSRACRAALEMQAGLRTLAEELKRNEGIEDFRVRIGINTGTVVVGEVGAGIRSEYTAMGTAVNIASRLESAAPVGGVLISKDTRRRLSDGFVVKPCGPLQLKSLSRTVEAFEVIEYEAERSARMSAMKTGFVGRRTEMDELRDTLGRLSSAHCGGAAAIIGEAGMGKTMLVKQLMKRNREDWRWVVVRCESYMANTSYALVRSILEALWSGEHPIRSEQIAELSERLAASQGVDLSAEDMAATLTTLTGPLTRDTGVDRTMSHVAPRQVIAAVTALITDRCRERPLVLVCEDLQWIDAASLSVLKRIQGVALLSPFFLLLTSRLVGMVVVDQVLSSFHGFGWRTHKYRLEPLTDAEARKLILNATGSADVAPSAVSFINSRSGGNPYFVAELTGSLSVSGGLIEDDGTLRLAPGSRTSAVPESLEAVITARLDRLRPAEKKLAQLIAIVGEWASRELVEQAAKDHLQEADIDSPLASLFNQGILLERKDDQGDTGAAALAFRHRLFAEVIRENLLGSQCRQLHRQIAETLQRMHPRPTLDVVEQISLHRQEAEEQHRDRGSTSG